MKTKLLSILSVAVAFGAVRAQAVKVDVDWPVFMARQDMVWDRLPIGQALLKPVGKITDVTMCSTPTAARAT